MEMNGSENKDLLPLIDGGRDDYQEIITFIRSRLNVIGTSVYLLESQYKDRDLDGIRHFRKINSEIESIRKVLHI